MEKKIYIYYLNPNLSEGGSSRNSAFFKVLAKKSSPINVFRIGFLSRLIVILQMLTLFLKIKNKKIFIHQGAVLFLFPVSLLKFKLYRFFLKSILVRLDRCNDLTFEVNDLPYEQSVDLGLEVKSQNKYFQKIILTLSNSQYIFASRLMRDFAVTQYSLNKENSSVIINGAPKFVNNREILDTYEFLKDPRLKFIYSGTLNQGRDIEHIINVFSNKPNKLLILIGPHGEWIKKDLKLPENIIYLGSFPENIAHLIVANCDVGLMHYDEKKLYYNICFPTKASFYVTAGIAVISTPMEEIYEHFRDYFIFADFSNWSQLIEEINIDDIKQNKSRINLIKEDYTWGSILKKINF